MHTHDAVVGLVCKCMECARKRDQRVQKEALRMKPQTWRAIEDDLLRAESLREEAKTVENDALRRRHELKEQALLQLVRRDAS